MLCPLCASEASRLFVDIRTRKEYGHCPACGLRFLGQGCRLSFSAEKAHYDQHKNDAEDGRYQEFVRPLHDTVSRQMKAGSLGLDYGAGPSSALARMLRSSAYTMQVYDPIYCPDEATLQQSYDFIVASEVAEHFHSPLSEFRKLYGMLRPAGILGLMTLLVTENTAFESWYYRTDPTHVVFYSEKTVTWIKNEIGFSSAETDGKRLVTFKK